MKKILLYILILIVLVGLFSPTVKLHAQTDTGYQLLSPLPCPASSTGSYGCDSSGLTSFNPKTGSLGGYLNLMIKLVIGISAVLAVVMIVLGGMQYMTSELISSKEAGKERITNAIFGLLLALGAYALLFTINPDLLDAGLSSLKEQNVTVAQNDRVPQTPVNGRYANGALAGSPWNDATAGPTRTPPPPQSVSLNASECTSIGQSNCTSTRGLNMNQVQAIQSGCQCPLVITGGTEWWLHGANGSTSHQAGNSTVDLRAGDSRLDNYLSGGKPLVAMTRYSSPVGSVLYEGNHWHIGP